MGRLSIGWILAALGALLATAAAAQSLPDRCRLEPVRGNCKAILEKFTFDQGRRKCVSFNYDGCGPVVPFEEMEECQALCETDATLRLASFRRVESRPFVLVDLEYPKNWKDDPAFVARVSGKEVASRRVGGGFSPNANQATLEVFLGAEPITELSVETIIDGKTYRVFMPLFWDAAPLLLLLDHAGRDEALLAPTDLRFVAFKAGTPLVRHNGTAIVPEAVIGSTGQATLWRVAPKWTAGRNAVSIEATASNGKHLQRDYSFVNLADGQLAYRQKIYLPYGAPGSRSGPFYRLETAGDAVALGADATVDIDSLDPWGWLTRDQRLVREVVGAVAGEAILRIYEKPHFLGAEQLKQEIHLRVSR